ncbi:MAG: DedA family protein [Calothrix sp. FI2-JRJ7]|jgi:membrane protein DedA with SNARE-associated domain|nr:DedA family protein [Calothrix sp. FI2-JRJ7]
MFDWIIPSVINIVYSLGYFGIALMMFLENLFPPIPSELIMPLAGFTANPVAVAAAQASGKLPLSVQPLNIGAVFLAGLIGSTLGGLVWYYPGKMLGEKRLKKLADKYGKWITVSSKDITKSIEWFDRQGSKAVFIGRLVPGVRTLISVPAGIGNMPLPSFLFYTTLGSALWTGLLTYSGYALGTQYELVDKYLAPVSKIVLAALVLTFGLWVFKRKQKRRPR